MDIIIGSKKYSIPKGAHLEVINGEVFVNEIKFSEPEMVMVTKKSQDEIVDKVRKLETENELYLKVISGMFKLVDAGNILSMSAYHIAHEEAEDPTIHDKENILQLVNEWHEVKEEVILSMGGIRKDNGKSKDNNKR